MGIIKDGKGTKHAAKVDNTNKLEVRGVNLTEFQDSLLEGKAFALASSVQTLTSTCISGLLYLKNCDDRDLLISKLVIITGTSTCGTGDAISTITINPTGGTLISGAGFAPAVNLNFGSAIIADVTTFGGSEGSTVTGGVPISDVQTSPQVRDLVDVAVLPKGFALAMSITPPAGNTSMKVTINIGFQFVEKR